MNRLIIISVLLVSIFSLVSEEIQDQLWLKAVAIKKSSLNTYPSKTSYSSVIKNKKGEIEKEEMIIIAHEDIDGQVVNTLIDAYDNEGKLDKENDSVKTYLNTNVLSDDDGIFQTETSDEFSINRVGEETIDGKKYMKYLINTLTFEDGKEIKSEGNVWLDLETGAPLKLELDIDPDQMMVKSLTMKNNYSLSQEGYLQVDKTITDISISIVFKKIFITQTVNREAYKRIN